MWENAKPRITRLAMVTASMTSVGAEGAGSVDEKLNAAFGRSLQSPALLARFAEQSIEPVGGSAELAGKLLKSDIVLWRQVLETKPKG